MMKKPEFIRFKPSDWLKDPGVSMLPDNVKGFWIDLLCQMFSLYPYGHLGIFSHRLAIQIEEEQALLLGKLAYEMGLCKKKELNKAGALKTLKEIGLEGALNPDFEKLQKSGSNFGVLGQEKWNKLANVLPIFLQRRVAISIENRLPKLMGRPPELVAEYMEVLEDYNIFSRTDNGLIYSRRLVEDWQTSSFNSENGSRGGNPLWVGKKNAERKSEKFPTENEGNSEYILPSSNSLEINELSITDSFTGAPNSLTINESAPPIDPPDKGGVILLTTTKKVSKEERESIEPKEYVSSSESTPNQKNGKEVVRSEAEARLADFKARMLENQLFTERIYMAAGIQPGSLESWIDLFSFHLITENKVHGEYQEFMSHFRNWIFKVPAEKKAKKQAVAPGQLEKAKTSMQNSKDLLSKYQ